MGGQGGRLGEQAVGVGEASGEEGVEVEVAVVMETGVSGRSGKKRKFGESADASASTSSLARGG